MKTEEEGRRNQEVKTLYTRWDTCGHGHIDYDEWYSNCKTWSCKGEAAKQGVMHVVAAFRARINDEKVSEEPFIKTAVQSLAHVTPEQFNTWLQHCLRTLTREGEVNADVPRGRDEGPEEADHPCQLPTIARSPTMPSLNV